MLSLDYPYVALRLRTILIRNLTPLLWAAFPQKKIAALQDFAETELDSAWQSLYASKQTSSPTDRAQLFFHALEEKDHADRFWRLGEKKAGTFLPRVISARKPVVEITSPEDLPKFLAYLEVGEKEVLKDFSAFTKAPIDQEVKQLFQEIIKEELHHGEVATQLAEKNNTANKISGTTFIAGLRKLYLEFSKIGLSIGEHALSQILTIVYFAFGWLFLRATQKRYRMSPQEQLLIFRQQQQQAEARLRDAYNLGRE